MTIAVIVEMPHTKNESNQISEPGSTQKGPRAANLEMRPVRAASGGKKREYIIIVLPMIFMNKYAES